MMPPNHLILSCLITLKFCCIFNSGIAANPFYDSRLHMSSKGCTKAMTLLLPPCYPSSMPWPRFPRKSMCKQEVAYEAMLGLKNTIYMSSHLQQNVIFNSQPSSCPAWHWHFVWHGGEKCNKTMWSFPSRALLKGTWLLYKKFLLHDIREMPLLSTNEKIWGKINTFHLDHI